MRWTHGNHAEDRTLPIFALVFFLLFSFVVSEAGIIDSQAPLLELKFSNKESHTSVILVALLCPTQGCMIGLGQVNDSSSTVRWILETNTRPGKRGRFSIAPTACWIKEEGCGACIPVECPNFILCWRLLLAGASMTTFIRPFGSLSFIQSRCWHDSHPTRQFLSNTPLTLLLDLPPFVLTHSFTPCQVSVVEFNLAFEGVSRWKRFRKLLLIWFAIWLLTNPISLFFDFGQQFKSPSLVQYHKLDSDKISYSSLSINWFVSTDPQ